MGRLKPKKLPEIIIPGEQYMRDAVKALQDLILSTLGESTGIAGIDIDLRTQFKNGCKFDHSLAWRVMPERGKKKTMALKKPKKVSKS